MPTGIKSGRGGRLVSELKSRRQDRIRRNLSTYQIHGLGSPRQCLSEETPLPVMREKE